jgi:hypothetical protein
MRHLSKRSSFSMAPVIVLGLASSLPALAADKM